MTRKTRHRPDGPEQHVHRYEAAAGVRGRGAKGKGTRSDREEEEEGRSKENGAKNVTTTTTTTADRVCFQLFFRERREHGAAHTLRTHAFSRTSDRRTYRSVIRSSVARPRLKCSCRARRRTPSRADRRPHSRLVASPSNGRAVPKRRVFPPPAAGERWPKSPGSCRRA